MKVILALSLVAVASGLTIPNEPHLKDQKAETDEEKNLQKVELNEFLAMFEGELDIEEGEAEVMSRMLMEKGISRKEYKEVHTLSLSHMTGRQKALWMLAAKEERDAGNKLEQVSRFGRTVPKFPRSYVEAVNNLDHTKTHRFMFSGSVEHGDLPNRKWLKSFVKKTFTGEDYYRATDARTKGKHYQKLGEYDQSATNSSHGFRPKDKGCCQAIQFDESYWKAMTQSKFVVCPGGDRPWSYRFYETFLTKAVPVIDSYNTDWAGIEKTTEITKIGFEHKMTSDFANGTVVYDPEMAERNYAKFIKYHTWIEGDNDPTDPQKEEKQYID